jgi:hypothetical protein
MAATRMSVPWRVRVANWRYERVRPRFKPLVRLAI